MDLELIKNLVKVVEESKITEFSVQEGDLKIRISKQEKIQHVTLPQPVAEISAPVNATAPAQFNQPVPAQTAEEKTPAAANLHEVKSPIVGTFYRAPSPDADPFVQVGDKITNGKVLCIVEAMKLMNEIESDVSGKVVKILVDNASPVEYNQPLFLVEKD